MSSSSDFCKELFKASIFALISSDSFFFLAAFSKISSICRWYSPRFLLPSLIRFSISAMRSLLCLISLSRTAISLSLRAISSFALSLLLRKSSSCAAYCPFFMDSLSFSSSSSLISRSKWSHSPLFTRIAFSTSSRLFLSISSSAQATEISILFSSSISPLAFIAFSDCLSRTGKRSDKLSSISFKRRKFSSALASSRSASAFLWRNFETPAASSKISLRWLPLAFTISATLPCPIME